MNTHTRGKHNGTFYKCEINFLHLERFLKFINLGNEWGFRTIVGYYKNVIESNYLSGNLSKLSSISIMGTCE